MLQSIGERNRVLENMLEQRNIEIELYKKRLRLLAEDRDRHEGAQRGRKRRRRSDENEMNGEPMAGTSSSRNDIPASQWLQPELVSGFSLRKMDQNVYEYLRAKVQLPLPDPRDLFKFAMSIKLVGGLQTTLLQILESDAEKMTDSDRVTILQISKFNTSYVWEYDEHNDIVFGRHKFVTLVVAKGLLAEWQQLIYMNFDTEMTEEILKAAITELHRLGFPVVGCVSNGDGKNPNLAAMMRFTNGQHSFQHPVTKESVFAFNYIDDLLMIINRFFMRGDFVMENQAALKEIISQSVQRLCRRNVLPRDAIEWLDPRCQNVKLIQQMYTRESISLLRANVSEDQHRIMKPVFEFMKLVRLFIDALMRHSVSDINSDVIPEIYFTAQSNKMAKIHGRLYKTPCVNENISQKFRDNVLGSILSLKTLFIMLAEKFKAPRVIGQSVCVEYVRERNKEIRLRNGYDEVLPPIQLIRVLKEIFLNAHCNIKLEPKVRFFANASIHENQQVKTERNSRAIFN